MAAAGDRHIVISVDSHGGAPVDGYRDYLESAYLEDFDRWAAGFEVPYEDMKGEEGSRNWDSDRRLHDLEQDGIVAEVLYPNTVPPFFSSSSLASGQAAVPDAAELSRRRAGLRAHNRWLADFCALAKGRRAGVIQVMPHDIDAAVADVRAGVAAGLHGGVLLPGTPPGSGLPPLYHHDHYDPLWETCAELGIPINCHSGSSGPRTGDRQEDDMFFLMEMKWWDQRTLRHLVLGGVLERHPGLKVVFTEAGTGWIPGLLRSMDRFFDSTRAASGPSGGELTYNGTHALDRLSLRPSEYWERQCYAGASFMHPTETAKRDLVGADRMMWGSDYPHIESSFPYSREAIRFALAGVPAAEAASMLGGTAAEVYGFSLDDLRTPAARCGPGRAEVESGMDPATLPPDAAKCPAFAGAMPGAALTQLADNRKLPEK
ncbi:amidohydrolase family protein [Actinomadura sp. WMMB 499]|uniref:amidohydrolase family protein n=1 Tax=Actinomadura sp. WMMB 499 TaxID=1219491 RepID=UPI0012452DC7|nr:amidohydrolase family protein [Actinomadura sp. WMMB 499]QFG22444.1 amidohydrolase [Actinomadura sp. WMMB 499]